ncbi:MAG TPA: peptidylprolyl isomerase [Candidatus Micrarchaeia archaeon]|nr:peptidylprolyl isomerase [Candidatus Micrarchaeia archaeon]
MTPPDQPADPAKRYRATIETDRGTVTIRLLPEAAPRTVANFVHLARQGFYDGLTFHRVVDGFVVQGGCPRGDGSGGPGYQFPDEPVVGDYGPGSVAMANSGKDTNGSQFFVSTVDNRGRLAKSYNLFGQVESGMEAVRQIRVGDRMRSVTIAEEA